MENGIIIDVGFKADIDSLISDINSQFKKIDFDNAIQLSDAFKKQEEDVKGRLKKLSIEINKALNNANGSDLVKEMNSVKQSVSALSSVVKAMQNSMPSDISSRFAANLREIGESAESITGIVTNATEAIGDLTKVNGGKKLEVVDNEQTKAVENLKNQYRELKKILKEIGEAEANISPQEITDNISKSDKAFEKLQQSYKTLLTAQDAFFDAQDSGNTDKITETAKAFGEQINIISKYISDFTKYGGDLDDVLGSMTIDGSSYKVDVSYVRNAIEDSIDEIKSILQSKKQELQEYGQQTFQLNLDELTTKSVKKDREGTIKVPMDISTTGKGLASRAAEIIKQAQSQLKDGLQIEVSFISSYATNKNQKTLNDIKSSLSNIDDEKIKSQIGDLIESVQKRIDDQLVFDINVKTEKASQAVKNFKNDVETQIKTLSDSLRLYPKIEIDDEARQELQAQLFAISQENFKINLNFGDKELFDGTIKSLSLFYTALSNVRDQIEKINTELKELPEKFSIQIDFDFLHDTNALGVKALSQLADIEKDISRIISNKAGESIHLSGEDKNKLVSDIEQLTGELDGIFKTGSMEKWANTFIQKLDTIKSKIRSLTGENPLLDMITGWGESDEIMMAKHGKGHIRERSAILGNDGILYGHYAYDQTGSTGMKYPTIDRMPKSVKPFLGIHSHASDRIVASSIPQSNGNGDLSSFAYQYFKEKIEKQLTVALDSIEVFDAKGFYDSNLAKGVDFQSSKIQEKIRSELAQTKITEEKYFQQFVEQFGSINKDIATAVSDNISNGGILGGKYISELKKNIDPDELLRRFFSNTESGVGSLNSSLAGALRSLVKFDSVDYSKLGKTSEEAENLYDSFIQEVYDNAIRILKDAFSLDRFDIGYNGKAGENGRDLRTYSFGKQTPEILRRALKGTGYLDNYSDFMKLYTKEEFFKQNPLSLSGDSLDKLFDSSVSANLLGDLEKVINDLEQIKTISSSIDLSDAFNLKLDENDLSIFTRSIENLISTLNELPSKFDTINSSSLTNNLSNDISQLSPELEKLKDSFIDLMSSGSTSDGITKFLNELNTSINNLSGKRADKKLQSVSENLKKFGENLKSINEIDTGNFLTELSSILEKSNELKSLAEVLKSTKKQIDTAGKAVKNQDNTDKASKLIAGHSTDITNAIQGEIGSSKTIISQQMDATKEGLVRVVAIVKDATGAYEKFTFAVDENMKAMQRGWIGGNDPQLQKQAKQIEAFEKLKDISKNLGDNMSQFNFGSDEWQKITDKASEFGIKAEDIVKVIRNIDQEMQESFQIFTKFSRVTVGMNSDGILYQSNTFDRDQLKRTAQSQVESIQKSLKNAFNGDNLGTEKAVQGLKELQDTWDTVQNHVSNGLIDPSVMTDLSQYILQAQRNIKQFSIDNLFDVSQKKNSTSEIIEQIQKAEEELKNLDVVFNKIQTGEPFSPEDLQRVRSLISLISQLNQTVDETDSRFAKSESVKKWAQKIATTMAKNTAMPGDIKNGYQEILDIFTRLGYEVPIKQFEELREKTLELNIALEQSGKTGKSLLDRFKTSFIAQGVSQLASMYLSLFDIIRYGREAFTVIKDLDTAMVDLRKTTTMNNTELNNFYKNSSGMAKEVGVTTKEIINQASAWSRLGFSSAEQAETMAKLSSQFAAISPDMDVDTATTGLVSVMKAFDIESDQVLDGVMSKVNALGKNCPKYIVIYI